MKFMVKLARSFYQLSDKTQFENFLKSLKDEIYIFTSFQLSEYPLTVTQKLEAIRLCQSYHKILIPDLHDEMLTPDMMNQMKLAGLTHVRLDVFSRVDVLEMLAEDFNIVVNASTYTKEQHDLLTQYIPLERIMACHNYYPKRYTGLSLKRFCDINQQLKSWGIKVAAFLPGDEISRGPMFEGLPTIEEHRHLSSVVAFLQLVEARSDVIFISEETISLVLHDKLSSLARGVIPLNIISANQALQNIWSNRVDFSDYLYRLQHTRGMDLMQSLDEVRTKHYHVGDIIQSNEKYARYQGEIEIVLKEIPYDDHYNLIGKVSKEDCELLPFVSSYCIQCYIQ